jgi:hypothetical protein
MITQPHFASHADQQAMLGCAANLDQDIHPRRWALEQARKRTPGKGRAELGPALTKLQARRAELAPRVRELALTMTQTEVQHELNISRTMLRTLAEEHDIKFYRPKMEVEPHELAKIQKLAKRMTRRKAAQQLNTSESRLGRIAKQYSFEFQTFAGTPSGPREVSPERLEMYRERLTALRDIGVSRSRAARQIAVTYVTFRRLILELGISWDERRGAE